MYNWSQVCPKSNNNPITPPPFLEAGLFTNIRLGWKFLPGTNTLGYLRYSCEALYFSRKRGNMVQNFVKTESFRPRKTSWKTVNFC